MNLELGWTYSFKFTSDFSALEGIYTVVKIYAYDEFVSDGNNLYELLYTRVSKPEVDFEEDVKSYRNEKIYKLVNPDDLDDILYIPEGIIAEVPNFNIKKYAQLIIALNVGVYPNEDELEYAKSTMQEQLQGLLGFVNPPDVISIGQVWLTDDEYNDIVAEREKNKTKNTCSLDNGKYITNYFIENQKLLKQIGELTQMNSNYEKMFVDLMDKQATVNANTNTNYIQVDTDKLRYQLTIDQVRVNDLVEVKETRSVYKVIDTRYLSEERGYSLYDVSDPTFIQVITEEEKLQLTRAQVQNNDRVMVSDTKTVYRVIDDTRLGTEKAFSMEIVEKSNAATPKLIAVENDDARFALTRKQLDEGDYVLVNSKYLYRVISAYHLEDEQGYQLVMSEV